MSHILNHFPYLISYLMLPNSLPRTILSFYSLTSHLFACFILSIVPRFDSRLSRNPTFLLHTPLTIFSEMGISLMIHTWTIFFRYPAYLALVAFGSAMEPFAPDAADLYLCVGL
ncbi:hypothetical protein F5Y12DRAFT_729507 [Xylaria sp. FL1777]|nr:hypothetical protein F5Y12DRAFT_729507 [Xylaria sp. FL1777]